MKHTFKDVSAEVLYDVVHDPDYRRQWDDHMIEGYEICTLDSTNDIGYYSGRELMSCFIWRIISFFISVKLLIAWVKN